MLTTFKIRKQFQIKKNIETMTEISGTNNQWENPNRSQLKKGGYQVSTRGSLQVPVLIKEAYRGE